MKDKAVKDVRNYLKCPENCFYGYTSCDDNDDGKKCENCNIFIVCRSFDDFIKIKKKGVKYES